MDPRAALRWLEAVSHAPAARRQRVIASFVGVSTLGGVASFFYNVKDNGSRLREAERVKRELLKHRL